MKKLFVTTFLACCAFNMASAEDIIEVAPVSMDANVDIESADCGSIEFTITSSVIDEISLVGFDLYIPDGIAFEPDYVYEGDLMPFTTDKRGNKTYKHTIDCQAVEEALQDKEGYTLYKVNVFSTQGATLLGESGESLMSFDLGSQNAGVYPIILKNVILAKNGTDVVSETPAIVSYVKVGEPTSATFAPEGTLSAVVNEALATEDAITTLDLTNTTASYGTFTYKEGRSVIAPTASVVAPQATYARNIAEGKWGSICLPIELTSTEKIKYYTLATVGSTYVTLTEAATVEANTPAFFQILSGDVVYAEGTDVELKATPAAGSLANGLTMTGTYASMNLAAGAGYYISDGKLYNDGASVAPFRTYLAGTVAGVKSLSVFVDDETGLHEITDQLSQEDIYNLQGMKLQQAQKGINIIGGKKVLRK